MIGLTRSKDFLLPEPEVSRRQALLALTLLVAGEREDLWHPGYRQDRTGKEISEENKSVVRRQTAITALSLLAKGKVFSQCRLPFRLLESCNN